MRLSIIIPTWCEAPAIAEAVTAASREADEVVVADGGSPDGTADRAAVAGARVVFSPKNRGAQLHAGARVATGDTLLFLHADTRLGTGAAHAVQRALSDPSVPGGNFFLRFVPETRVGRAFTRIYDLRRRVLGIYYGDSAIFVRKHVYEQLGGFRPLPVLEDWDFVRRLERVGPTAYLSGGAETSGRRYEGHVVRTLLSWVSIQGLYTLGVSPQRLARFYADRREELPGGRRATADSPRSRAQPSGPRHTPSQGR